MSRLRWVGWQGDDLLQNLDTEKNVAWVSNYGASTYTVELWDRSIDPQGDWVEIARAPDRDAAKMIALMNVEGTLV